MLSCFSVETTWHVDGAGWGLGLESEVFASSHLICMTAHSSYFSNAGHVSSIICMLSLFLTYMVLAIYV